MAVNANFVKKSLVLFYESGTTATGAPRYRRYTFPNVNEKATNEKISAAGELIAGLLSPEITDVHTVEESALEEVGA